MKTGIKKLLIANRGEICCRIIKTAKKMGIATVAVYSDADKNALHVKMADEAVNIGAAPSRESYLLGDKIIAVAKALRVDAIHPGYGFLSENAAFCRKCKENGIIFVGPPVKAIEAMGSKSAAKQIMQEAGVPLVPGYHGENQSPDFLKQQADDMGYPVLLKAAAGGGGKGMRQVHSEEEFFDALDAAKREAMSGFNDDIMLIEKYLTQPRHVEIQVFCDQHKNGVYLFERDCSVQRRHQKVIEEAPAPGMTAELRQQMGEAGLKAAKAIDYEGAGTVEFLLEPNGEFFFMEMNTRLQVEHPVTEMITQEDLVEWQLRVASGEVIPKTQQQLTLKGHAFEARVYAEDPDNEFLPSTGKLRLLKPPLESENVRVDTGVLQGDEVSVFYDPMIAKLIVWDENREKALARMSKALAEYHVEGVRTNIDFLYNLATHPAFQNANLTTNFIEEHQEHLFVSRQHDLEPMLPVVSTYLMLKRHSKLQNKGVELQSPWQAGNNWRMNEVHEEILSFVIQNVEASVTVSIVGKLENNELQLLVQTSENEYSCQGQLVENSLLVNINGHRSKMTVVEHEQEYSLFTPEHAIKCRLLTPDLGIDDSDEHHAGFVAPMNGTVVGLMVELNQSVKKGQTLMIMEAMKMEHALKAPKDGVVTEFYYQSGDLVDGGAALLNFEANAAED